jgi:SAM-dependent methyltransferase
MERNARQAAIVARSLQGDAMTTPSESWDSSYAASTSPPWDIGRPQPVFVRLADAGLLTGRVLDAGCGTGEHTLLAASKGADAFGIDISPRAIQRARDKAVARGIAARFEVADALNLGQFGRTFDTVIDSGAFHVFDDDDRARYVASLASVLEPGGSCYLICFSELQPGDFGPRRVRQDELRAAFSNGWDVTEIVPEKFEINPESGFGTAAAHAWLATIRRLLLSPRRAGHRAG